MMQALSKTMIAVSLVVPTAIAATVIDPVARQGDPVPGQAGASGFSTNFSRPSINESGVVVFEGIGPVAAGIYVKRPGMPLTVLVDGTMASPGVPTFAVPGHPAGTAFSLFKAPLVNDVGDVVFFASFSGGNGIFAANIAGGPIVKLADSTDTVPGFPTTLFSFFEFSLDRSILVASLNNNGDVVILGRFRRSSDSFDQIGLYATTVAGGPLVRLVDGTESFAFTPSTLPNRSPSMVLSGINTAAPALTDTGHVVFRGTARFPATTVFLNGVFSIPLSGSAAPTIVALKFDAAPTASATVASFGGFFGDYDVTDSGVVVFHARHSVNTQQGLYAGDVNGGPLSLVVDNLGGFAVPGRPAGVNFTSMLGAPVNATGQVGFFSFDNAPTPSNGGIYATDLSAGAAVLVINTLGIIPPGRAVPSVFNGLTEFSSPPINDSGNMVIGANGNDGVGTIFGLYFFNACSGTLDRIADDVTASIDLGGSFLTNGNRGFEVHAGFDVRQGHFESLNNSNQVAFLVRFSNFDAGIFVASVAGGGGGTTTITCPADLALECPAGTGVGVAGMATAAGGCSGASIATSFLDVNTANCGGTETITRTWSADDGLGGAVVCDQIVSTVDTTAPDVNCPADIAVSGGFGGRAVSFSPSTSDTCDPNPSIAATPMSGSFFPTGVTSVSATAADACGNTSLPCSFNVLVSCFGVNRAKIGTKDAVCRGVESIEFTSMTGTEELISLFKAQEGSGGGVAEDILPASIIVDDGVNGPITVDTSCGVAIQIGDAYGPYTVSDIDQDFDDQPDSRGNDVQIRGTFVPAVPFDLAVDDFHISIDDGQGDVALFTVPAGSFVSDGNPSKGKFKFEGNVGTADVKVKLKGCKVEFKAKNATNTATLTGTAVTVRLAVGPNLGEDMLVMEDKGNHLKFKRQPKVNCCPSCRGVASMQVTSGQGVLVFVPDAGQSKLNANTVMDDGVNGPVTIHTSCSQPIDVGDTFGPYTISEVIKVFDGS